MASSTSGGRSSSSRENTAKSMVSDQISQAVLSTSNLLHLMQQSFPVADWKDEGVERPQLSIRKLKAVILEAQLIKLPKNLLLKSSTIKNTGHLLEQMPRVISSLDAHMETGLQSLPHLQTVIQLLTNMESCQLNSLSQARILQEEQEAREKIKFQMWSDNMQ